MFFLLFLLYGKKNRGILKSVMKMLKDNNTLKYHIACTEADVGKYCILPGDPGRCEKIAKYLDFAKFVVSNREYTTYTGLLCGEKVSVVSTGIGGPSAAIAVEELASLGVHTFIRIGTCGGINTKVCPGDVVIATSAVRCDGTTREYAPECFPATADFEATSALVSAAEELGFTHHVGVVHSKDAFYGQANPENMPMSQELLDKWETWKRLGVLASEMEASTLFVVGAARKLRCGACFNAIWNQEREKMGLRDEEHHDTDRAVRVAVQAIKLLIEKDKR